MSDALRMKSVSYVIRMKSLDPLRATKTLDLWFKFITVALSSNDFSKRQYMTFTTSFPGLCRINKNKQVSRMFEENRNQLTRYILIHT